MEKVSFNVAKAIKEAGYPQVLEYWKYLEDNTYWYYPDGKLEKKGNVPDYIDISKLTFAPYIMEVWMWLWREKGLFIKVYPVVDKFSFSILFIEDDAWENCGNIISEYVDPEEAIIAAIEYIVNNDLIK